MRCASDDRLRELLSARPDIEDYFPDLFHAKHSKRERAREAGVIRQQLGICQQTSSILHDQRVCMVVHIAQVTQFWRAAIVLPFGCRIEAARPWHPRTLSATRKIVQC